MGEPPSPFLHSAKLEPGIHGHLMTHALSFVILACIEHFVIKDNTLDYENQLTPSNYSGLQDETAFLNPVCLRLRVHSPLSVDVVGERPPCIQERLSGKWKRSRNKKEQFEC